MEWWSGGVVERWRGGEVVLTAYIRVFGGAREFAQDFRGRVTKQHRLAVSTVGCLLSIVEHFRMEGKEVGAMPGNRTTAPYMSRRARVAGGVFQARNARQ
jgi:hypothetical protein